VSFHLSVPAWAHCSKPTAAGLLVCAPAGRRYGSIAAAAAGEYGQCHIGT